MACDPMAGYVWAQGALVPLRATPLVPPPPAIAVAPSKNSTLPVGLPAPGEVTETVAVYVTLCPTTDGFDDEANAVEVLALLTVCDSAGDVDPPKLPLSDVYTAVMECGLPVVLV